MYFQIGKLTLSLSLVFLFISIVCGQDLDEVAFRGTISDILGGAVPGAVVTAVHSPSGVRRSVTSDASGRFSLIELPPGHYVISASADGFATFDSETIETVSGESIRLDLRLHPSDVTGSVTIVTGAGESSVDISRTVVGSTLDERELESLPDPSGNVLDLVFVLGGTDEEPFSIDGLADDDRIGNGSESDKPSEVIGAGSISLSGGAAYSTNITIDGMDNNDDRTASERFQPPPDAVGEVQVVANQFSAEYGRASGGRVNVRTRSGTERPKGVFRLSFEDASLNANTYNNNRRGLGKLPFRKIDPGVTLLGRVPGSAGRTRFLASYFRQERLSESLIDTMVPVDDVPLYALPAPTHPYEARVDDIPDPDSDSFPAVNIAPYRKTVATPGSRKRLLARVDHKFSDLHSVKFTWQYGRSRDLRQYRETTRYLEETLQARLRKNDAFQLGDTLVLGASTVNQFRFQFSDHRPGFAAGGAEDPVVLLFISDDSRAGSGDQVRGTIVAGNSTANFANLRRERRYQFQDTLSAVAGRHTVRFGVDLQIIRSSRENLSDATGTFNFKRVYDLIAGRPSRYRRRFGATSVQRNTYLGLFAQDDLQLRSNLTLTAGLRLERESILRDDNNFGPRIALAWSPGDNGRSVLRLGAGVFYNRVLLRTLDDYSAGRQQVRFDSEALAGPSSEARCLDQIEPGPNALTDKCRFLAALAARFPNAPDESELRQILSELDIADGGFLTDTNFTRFVQDGIRIPESYQFNAGYERELGIGFVIEANVTFNKASGLWRETNVNAFRPPEGFATMTDYLLALGTFGLGGTPTRFELGDPGDLQGVSEQDGVRVVNLRSLNPSESSRAPIGIAFSALEATLVRPFDPSFGQVEMVSSIGRSVYEGVSVSLRRSFRELIAGVGASFRASYSFSRNRDDGFVDTSSAQTAGDFAGEFSASSIDRRHRLRFSGRFILPQLLGGIRFSPVLRLESARPFNISIGGSDRNLDDVGNDRPNFSGRISSIVSRSPGDPYPQELADSFSLAPIGSPGNLARNAGRGPLLFVFNAAFRKPIRFSERFSIVPELICSNILNAKVFSFGSDYIDLSESGTTEFKQGFLVPGRTLSQRKIRLGLKFEF